jgi:oligopeptide/dipeptide ABC transporter ATP-binding protein
MYLENRGDGRNIGNFFRKPLHPYTQALLSAIPVAKLQLGAGTDSSEGDVPSPVNTSPGCRFMPRCHYARKICSREMPKLREHEPQHFVALHFTGNLQPKTTKT